MHGAMCIASGPVNPHIHEIILVKRLEEVSRHSLSIFKEPKWCASTFLTFFDNARRESWIVSGPFGWLTWLTKFQSHSLICKIIAAKTLKMPIDAFGRKVALTVLEASRFWKVARTQVKTDFHRLRADHSDSRKAVQIFNEASTVASIKVPKD